MEKGTYQRNIAPKQKCRVNLKDYSIFIRGIRECDVTIFPSDI